ncbi:MAG: HD domain-containing protein [Rhodobacterales bacterium]|nr:HD domain-containing protein [Rhodobacterales bacterium]
MTSLLLEVLGLKALPRAGWVERGIPHPESVAAHSWGVAWLVLMLLPKEMNQARALKYAVLHDLAEVRVGDITPQDGVLPEEKAHREARAMATLFAQKTELLADWQRYESQVDPESQFVRQLDRLDMALQAVSYSEAHAIDLTEFLDSAALVITHPTLTSILAELRGRFR